MDRSTKHASMVRGIPGPVGIKDDQQYLRDHQFARWVVGEIIGENVESFYVNADYSKWTDRLQQGLILKNKLEDKSWW